MGQQNRMQRTEVLRVETPGALNQAVAVLRTGGLVAFPTDTVYGVAADPLNEAAVSRLYAAKVRPEGKAIPLLLGDAGDLDPLAVNLPPVAERLIGAFWPGALTLVVWRSRLVADVVAAGGPTVAVRLPDHVVARALARSLGGALAATSANRSGAPEATTAAAVMDQLAGRIDLVLDGGVCAGGIASTVLDLTTEPPRLVRPGSLDVGLLQRILAQPDH